MAAGDTDSEEYMTQYCTSCELEDKHVAAFGYCLMCIEYLCKQCYKSHRKPLITRNHVLLKEDEMPIKDITKENKHMNVLCQFHEKPIDYYCKKCDNVGCYGCMSIHHKICVGVTFIPQYLESKQEVKCKPKRRRCSFMSVCDDPINSTKNLETTLKRLRYVVERNTEKVKQQVKDFHDDMTNALDEFEVSVNRKVDNISLEDNTQLDTISKKSKYYQDMFEDYKNSINNSDGPELFVHKALAEDGELDFEENKVIEKLKDQMKIRRIRFKASWPATSGKYGGFGNLLDVSTVTKQMTLKQDVVLKAHFKSVEGCYIRECIILQNGYLMFTDTTGKTVRVCYTEGNKSQVEDQEDTTSVISALKFDNPPWGLVEIEEGPEVAVTIPKFQKVVFLIISCCNENNNESVKVSVDGAFKTKGECQSIAWLGEELVVSFSDPAKVEIISLDGDVLKTVRDMKDEAWGFQDPTSVACDVKQQLIYVADFNKDIVVLADCNGNVKAVYDKTFDSPRSLAVDKDGAVLVAVKWPFSLQMISSDFYDNKTLLDRDQVWGIQCIAYAASDHSVYVASQWGSSITKWKIVD